MLPDVGALQAVLGQTTRKPTIPVAEVQITRIFLKFKPVVPVVDKVFAWQGAAHGHPANVDCLMCDVFQSATLSNGGKGRFFTNIVSI